MNYIGIDIGTTGGKAAVFSEKMELLYVWRKDYPTHLGEGGRAEQDPEDWWRMAADGIREALRETGVSKEEIGGIGLSCMTPVLLPLDAKGNPLEWAWLWYDARGAAYLEKIREKLLTEEQIQIAGSACKEVSFLNKLLCFREEMPEKYRETAVFLQPSGYLAYRMTGQAGMDASHGELLFLVDKERGDYSPRVFDAFSLDREKFPGIHPVNRIVGTLTPEAARELGLLEGTPVLSGGHDSALSAYALGVCRPGDACLDIGNAANLAMCTEKSVYCPAGDAYRHPVDGKWLFQIYSATIGAAFRWFRDVFGKEEVRAAKERGISVYDLLCETAREASPGAGGLLFLPYLQGAQQSAEASGAFLNIRMTSGRAEFVRALLEGCAYSVRYNMEQMETASGLEIERITVCGGGSRNRFWLQIFADILQKPLDVSRMQEAAITGAAMLVKEAAKRQNTSSQEKAVWKEPGEGGKPEGIRGDASQEPEDRVAETDNGREQIWPDPGMREIYDRGYAKFREAFEGQVSRREFTL